MREVGFASDEEILSDPVRRAKLETWGRELFSFLAEHPIEGAKWIGGLQGINGLAADFCCELIEEEERNGRLSMGELGSIFQLALAGNSTQDNFDALKRVDPERWARVCGLAEDAASKEGQAQRN